MNKLITLIKRIANRSSIIIRDYYIDFLIQKRFIGDRRIQSVDPESGIHQWQSTTYDAIDDIFFKGNYITIKQTDVIADVGCGDGKMFNFYIYKGLKNKMIGYEINKTAGAVTKRKLLKYPNVKIVLDNIFDHFPTDATLFYLFNPFGEKMMLLFIENIKKLRASKPTIVYNYPLFVHLFDPQIFNIAIIKIHQYQHADGKVAIIDFKA